MEAQVVQAVMEIKQQVGALPEIRDRLSRVEDKMDERMEKAEARISVLEQAKDRQDTRISMLMWVGRAAAALGGVLLTLLGWLIQKIWLVPLLVLAMGCASSLPAPNGADEWWRARHKPIPVAVDSTMPEGCLPAAEAGLTVWLERGVEARLVPVGRVSDDDLQNPPSGRITIAYREDLSRVWMTSPKAVGSASSRDVLGRLRGCSLAVSACAPVVFAHEIGHCLGLNHQPDAGWLMTKNAGGHPEWIESISQEEINWVTQ